MLLVIHSITCALCSHLFTSSATLSWMEVTFWNQNPCIPSWLDIIQFDIFFRVILSKSMCISAFGSSSGPSTSLVISFIHSAISLCFFGFHILVQNHSFFVASGCWYVFVSSPPSCWYFIIIIIIIIIIIVVVVVVVQWTSLSSGCTFIDNTVNFIFHSICLNRGINPFF